MMYLYYMTFWNNNKWGNNLFSGRGGGGGMDGTFVQFS